MFSQETKGKKKEKKEKKDKQTKEQQEENANAKEQGARNQLIYSKELQTVRGTF